ncbi:MAG: hypothetical protein K2P65_15735 [Lachnospiraceae bacterium]|nr:hypothetical protein [Lachnospiraceae bacterium]
MAFSIGWPDQMKPQIWETSLDYMGGYPIGLRRRSAECQVEISGQGKSSVLAARAGIMGKSEYKGDKEHEEET